MRITKESKQLEQAIIDLLQVRKDGLHAYYLSDILNITKAACVKIIQIKGEQVAPTESICGVLHSVMSFLEKDIE